MTQTAGTAGKGLLVVLALGSGVTAIPIASAKTNSLTMTNAAIDTTTKRDLGFGSSIAGLKEITIALDGVFYNEVYDKTIRGYAADGSLNVYTLTTTNGDTWVGPFLITSYGVGGVFNAAETFTIAMKSSGVVTYTASV
jgi:predicted secreted protein